MPTLCKAAATLQRDTLCHMTLKHKSLPVHSNMICFIKFSYSVYMHSRGINRFHRVRSFILKRIKRVKLTSNVYQRDGWRFYRGNDWEKEI